MKQELDYGIALWDFKRNVGSLVTQTDRWIVKHYPRDAWIWIAGRTVARLSRLYVEQTGEEPKRQHVEAALKFIANNTFEAIDQDVVLALLRLIDLGTQTPVVLTGGRRQYRFRIKIPCTLEHQQ